MTYNDWVMKLFPAIISFKVAEDSKEGKTAIFSLKDREFTLVNIIDEIITIYNSIELYDTTLFFDRFYFIFKDTISEDMKVVFVTNSSFIQYLNHTVDYNIFEKQIEIRDIKLRQQTDARPTN